MLSYCTVKTVVPFTPFRLALIVVVPVEALLANPFDLMVATLTLDEVQVTCTVMFTTELSVKVPCAANSSDDPRLIEGLLGVTAIEVRVAVVTVRFAVPLIPANAAETVVPPGATPFATPALSAELLTVATDGVEEVQVTADVRSNCWPSLNVPVAVSWVSMVAGSLRLCGVILIETRFEPSTTSASDALFAPKDAVIEAVPACWPVTTPETPTVATLVSDEDQVAYTFTFCVLPSLHFPLALKDIVAPGARMGFGLLVETAIELRVAALTATGVLPVRVTPAKLKDAVTLAVPWVTPSSTPMLLPGALNLATAELSELHVTEVVTSWVEESLNVPVAENCWCQPIGIVWFTGVTVMD